MSKQDTKQTLLEIGRSAFLRNGFNHTGINEVLETAGVPKGSFYYYFSSKEDFGLQVLDYHGQGDLAALDGFIADETLPPLARLRAYFDANIQVLAAQGCGRGCLIGNLGQEMADQSEAFRRKLDEVMSNSIAAIQVCLEQAQRNGDLDATQNAGELAEFCLSSWQGAVLRMKVVKSDAPLQAFIHSLFDIVLKN